MVPGDGVRLAVVGTGLIGASVGLAAGRAGFGEVAGWDRGLATRSRWPRSEGRSSQRDRSRRPSPKPRSRWWPCPWPRFRAPCAAFSRQRPRGCTVTDVGLDEGVRLRGRGGRPALRRRPPDLRRGDAGPGRASAELFDGATWFLTPLASTEPERYRAIHALVTSLGARPVAIDPDAHDRLVAVTSHLPHALANVLLNHAGATRMDGHEPLAAAGGSLRDMTRIAGANPRIWVDIFLDNRAPLATALAEHRRRVEQLEAALAEGDAGFLARWIGEAAGNRRRMLETAYEDAGRLHRLRVHVPDRPGVLAGIFQALGAQRINVADFDLEHLSHDRGGTLTILVTGEEDAALAAAMLEEQGYGVVAAPVVEDA